MDGKALDDATEDILARGWDVLGIFHSHVATEAEPSPTDVAKAEGSYKWYPKAAYAIMTLKDPEPRLRAFSIADGEVREVEVDVRDGNGLA
jgi:proteasome lid subunit RPN8/RPN11